MPWPTAAGSLTITDEPACRGSSKNWRSHTGEILSHHGIEDTIFFPALRQRSPETARVLDQLDREHHRLDQLMEAAEVKLGRVVAGAAPTGAVDTLRRLAELMDDHLDLEDREVVPQFVELFTADGVRGADEGGDQADRDQQAGRLHRPLHRLLGDARERDLLLGQAPLPFRILYHATRRRHGKLATLAFGNAGR